MRVKMINAKTIAGDGSSTTYLADHYYILSDELAETLIDGGDAELDGDHQEV